MLDLALAVVSVLAGLATGVAAWLWVERRRLLRERDELRTQVESQRQTLAERDRDLALSKQKLEALDEKQADLQKLLDQAKQQFKDTFDALAGKALKGSTDEFLKLAKQVFEHEQQKQGKQLEANRQAVEQLINPVKESLTQYQQTLAQAEKQRQEAYGSLKQQAESLAASQQELNAQTGKLVQALRRPEVRGRWGEMQLRRVVEMAGMIEYVDFVEQESMDSGRKRPDMVVRLPSERRIVIDAKTPLDAYLDALECVDEADRSRKYEQHAEQLHRQIQSLSRKDYLEQFERTPDFVVLFIPGESFLQAAVQVRPQLIEQAMDQNVVVATPSTLMSLLRAIELGWREQALAENAQHIAELGREMHKRLSTVMEHVVTLGKRIDKAVEGYNTLVGSLDKQVMPQARRFTELRAESNKSLPQNLEPISTAARPLSEASLTAGEEEA